MRSFFYLLLTVHCALLTGCYRHTHVGAPGLDIRSRAITVPPVYATYDATVKSETTPIAPTSYMDDCLAAYAGHPKRDAICADRVEKYGPWWQTKGQPVYYWGSPWMYRPY